MLYFFFVDIDLLGFSVYNIVVLIMHFLNKVKINPGTYSITKDGDICIGIIEEIVCNGEVVKIDVKGEKPSNGKIIVNQDNNLEVEYFKLNEYTYYKNFAPSKHVLGIRRNSRA